MSVGPLMWGLAASGYCGWTARVDFRETKSHQGGPQSLPNVTHVHPIPHWALHPTPGLFNPPPSLVGGLSMAGPTPDPPALCWQGHSPAQVPSMAPQHLQDKWALVLGLPIPALPLLSCITLGKLLNVLLQSFIKRLLLST